MFDKHHKKENPTFTGITRGVGGFGFGAGSQASGVSDNYWIAKLGDSNHDSRALGVAVDSVGNIYATGYTKDTTDASNTSATLTVKYDTNGVVQWQRTLGGTHNYDDRGYDIAVDNSDNIIVVGRYSPSNQSGTTQYDGFIAKYNTSGVLQWVRVWESNEYHLKVDLDNNGNIYIATYPNGHMMMVSKFDASGDHEWSRTLDSTRGGGGATYDIAVDKVNGGVYTVGDSRAFSSFVNDETEGVLAKYSDTGTLQWVKAWDTNPEDDNHEVEGKTVSVDSSGNALVTGHAENGGTGTGTADIFYIRFASNGNVIEDAVFNSGSSIDDESNGAVCSSLDKLYIAGETNIFESGLLLKYDATDTTRIYSRELKATAGDETRLSDVDVDNENKAVYVAGYTTKSSFSTTKDVFLVVKVPADGSMTSASYGSGNTEMSYLNAAPSGSQSYDADYRDASSILTAASETRTESSETVDQGVGSLSSEIISIS